MHVHVLEENLDVSALLADANKVKVFLGAGWRDVTQVGLQAPEPNADPKDWWDKSVGRSTRIQFPENYFKYTMFDTPLLNSYIEKYGLRRTRLMNSHPKSTLSMHQDLTKRIHIPLISNPDCLMIIDGQTYFLEPGNVYLTDTTYKHTAINASNMMRLHLVGCMYD